jgi:hypothetical protein
MDKTPAFGSPASGGCNQNSVDLKEKNKDMSDLEYGSVTALLHLPGEFAFQSS